MERIERMERTEKNGKAAGIAQGGLIFTAHAQQRVRQRNLKEEEIDYVLAHGRIIHRSGAAFYFLGSKDIPVPDRKLPWVQHLAGVTLLVNSAPTCSVLITAYRNERGLHTICKKSKYRIFPC